jgi:hypothetical protein
MVWYEEVVLGVVNDGLPFDVRLVLCNNLLRHVYCTLFDFLYIVAAPLLVVANMRLTSFIVAIAVAIGVAQADFMVYTLPPIPTDQRSVWSCSTALKVSANVP